MKQGILVLNKPVGMRSTDCVGKLRKRLGKDQKLGHAGTLDSGAEGLLVLLLGSATRLSRYAMELPKTYVATVRFGVVTDTDDATGKVITTSEVPPKDILLEKVRHCLPGFLGHRLQRPPSISAVHVGGRRAHEMARGGIAPDIAEKYVYFHRLGVEAAEDSGEDILRFRIECGKGTYIRSFARDLGAFLGCGAHVASLQRSRVGSLSSDDAAPGDVLYASSCVEVEPWIRPISDLLRHFVTFQVVSGLEERLANGGAFSLRDLSRTCWGNMARHAPVVVESSRHVALGRIVYEGIPRFEPETVIVKASEVM
jgi:tRNA pseudouridine55 synthase